MSANGVTQFIAALDLLFPAPQFGGDRARQMAWAKTYSVALCNTDDELLAAARDRFIRTRDPREPKQAFFPSIAECLEVIREVGEERERRATPLLEKPAEMPYDARIALARDLMQSPGGRQAVRDGWGEAMFHFAVEHQRVPAGREVDECKASARQFKAACDQLLKGDHPLAGPWAKYAQGMVRKARERMGEKVA